MTEIAPEIKEQLHKAIDASDIDSLRDTLNALNEIGSPETVTVEFTRSQYKFLESVRKDLNQPDIAAIMRMMVDSFKPGYLAQKKKKP